MLKILLSAVELRGIYKTVAARILMLARLAIILSCVLVQLSAIKNVEDLWTKYDEYVANIPHFSTVKATLLEKEQFTVLGDRGDRYRYVRITYRYTVQGRAFSSSCISFNNCAGLEVRDFSTELGMDLGNLKINDPLVIYVSIFNPKLAYVSLESATVALRHQYVRTAFWVTTVLLGV